MLPNRHAALMNISDSCTYGCTSNQIPHPFSPRSPTSSCYHIETPATIRCSVPPVAPSRVGDSSTDLASTCPHTARSAHSHAPHPSSLPMQLPDSQPIIAICTTIYASKLNLLSPFSITSIFTHTVSSGNNGSIISAHSIKQ